MVMAAFVHDTTYEKTPYISTTSVDDDSTPGALGTDLDVHPKEPVSFWKQLPLVGFGALLGVLLCTGASVVILKLSDGVSKDSLPWNGKLVTPNVLLNIFNNVANICIAVALAQGIAISWWRMARNGAYVEDLHLSLSLSTLIMRILRSPRSIKLRHFNVIALAALVAKLAFIDSTLLQEATKTTQDLDVPRKVTLAGFAYQEFLITGRVAGAGDTIDGLMSIELSSALKIWAASPKSIPAYFKGCSGACFPTVEAIGFEVACLDETSTTIDYAKQTRNYTADNGTDVGYETGPSLFSLSFDTEADDEDNAYINMKILYTQSNDTTDGQSSCPGLLKKQTCSLRPALVAYPIMFQDFSGDWASYQNVQVGPNLGWWLSDDDFYVPTYDAGTKQLQNYSVLSYLNYSINESTSASGQSHLAGLQAAFKTYLGGDTNIVYYGKEGYDLAVDGNAPYYLLSDANKPNLTQCGYWYDNPIAPRNNLGAETVIQKINEIVFTYAMDLQNISLSAPRNYPNVSESAVSIHYHTNNHYLIAAMASTVICVLLVLPSYWGFWQLGRKVSTNPIEIAHAFSYMTQHVQDHTEDGLLKHFGDKKVVYDSFTGPDGRKVVGLRPKSMQPVYLAGR